MPATHRTASIGPMTERSATRPGDGRAVPTWFVLGLVGMAAILAYIALWNGVARTGSLFGDRSDRLHERGRPPGRHRIALPSRAVRGSDRERRRHPDRVLLPAGARPGVPAAARDPAFHAGRRLVRRRRPSVSPSCCRSSLPDGSAVTLNGALLAIGFGLVFYPLQIRHLRRQRQRLAGDRCRDLPRQRPAHRREPSPRWRPP